MTNAYMIKLKHYLPKNSNLCIFHLGLFLINLIAWGWCRSQFSDNVSQLANIPFLLVAGVQLIELLNNTRVCA